MPIRVNFDLEVDAVVYEVGTEEAEEFPDPWRLP